MPVFGASIAPLIKQRNASARTAPSSLKQSLPQPSSAGRAARWWLCVSLRPTTPTMRSPHMGRNLTRRALHRLGACVLAIQCLSGTIGAIETMERRDVQCDQCRGKGKREKRKRSVGRGAAWCGGWPLHFVVRRWAAPASTVAPRSSAIPTAAASWASHAWPGLGARRRNSALGGAATGTHRQRCPRRTRRPGGGCDHKPSAPCTSFYD